MLFTFVVVMAGVLLLTMVVNNRRELRSCTEASDPRGGMVAEVMFPPGHSAVIRVGTRAATAVVMRAVGVAMGWRPLVDRTRQL
jgi:hypothetical protein